MQPSEASNQSASAVPNRPAGWPHWLTFLLLLGAGIAARLWCLVCKPFWFDEAFSVEVARLDWRNFLHVLWWREGNMSLYYVLLRIWLLFGQSPYFIRGLSVLIAVATLPAIYWLGRLLYDREVALIAAALFAFNAYDVRYAQEARSYALFVLLATFSSGFLIAWLQNPARRHRLGYIVSSALAVYAHFYALLLLVAHWIARRAVSSCRFPVPGGVNSRSIEGGTGRHLRRMWIAIAIAVAPLLIFVAKTGAGPIKWNPRPGLHDVLDLYEHLAGSGHWLLLLIYAVACAAAISGSAKHLLERSTNWEAFRCLFLLIWLIFPVLLTVLLSFARPVFLDRYMIFCLPAFLILTAAGLARLRPSWLLAAVLAAILLLGLRGTYFVYAHDFDTQRDASGAATNFILDHTQPGDAILFHIAETRIPFEFFRSLRTGRNTAGTNLSVQLGPEILFPHHGSSLDYRDFTGKPTADLVRSFAPSHPRVWVMLMNNGPAGDPDPTTLMLTQVLTESFPRVMRWQFTKVEVRLYARQ